MSENLDAYCFRGSIAKILDINIDDVPIFVSDKEGDDHGEWLQKYREWIKKYDGDILSFWFDGFWKLDKLINWWSGCNPGRTAILQGNAGGNGSHAVLIKDGKIVYNTSPANKLIPEKSKGWPDGVWYFYVITKSLEIK